MSLLALMVSVEELARELQALLRGRPEIAYGNVSGSILVFYHFKARIIALIHPQRVPDSVLNFYLPVSLATVLFLTFLMALSVMPRWAGRI